MLDIFIANLASQTRPDVFGHDFSKTLDNHEIARFDKIKNTAMKERYFVCRCVLKQIISAYTHQRTSDVKIGYNSFGKPFVQDSRIHFNLSHSGDHLVIGVSDEELGVDVETIRPINLDVAKSFCTENELSYIHHAEDRYDRFFRVWTLKEAYVKKIGKGLYFDVKNIDLSIEDSGMITFKINNCSSESAWFFTKKIENNILSVCCKTKNKTPNVINLKVGQPFRMGG